MLDPLPSESSSEPEVELGECCDPGLSLDWETLQLKLNLHAHGVGRVVGALGSEADFAGSMLN